MFFDGLKQEWAQVGGAEPAVFCPVDNKVFVQHMLFELIHTVAVSLTASGELA